LGPYFATHYQFNGIELFEDLDLNVNFAFYRSYDPAIGRWWQVNPKAESFYGMNVYNGILNASIGVIPFFTYVIESGIGGVINVAMHTGLDMTVAKGINAFVVGAIIIITGGR